MSDEMEPYKLRRRPLVERHPESADDIRALQDKILALERELGTYKTRYEQLEITYNKLADQWNVFQATSRPDNRNIQRAEGAGEMARKMGEIFVCLAYDTDARELIAQMLARLERMQGRAEGQEVEVSGKLTRRR